MKEVLREGGWVVEEKPPQPERTMDAQKPRSFALKRCGKQRVYLIKRRKRHYIRLCRGEEKERPLMSYPSWAG